MGRKKRLVKGKQTVKKADVARDVEEEYYEELVEAGALLEREELEVHEARIKVKVLKKSGASKEQVGRAKLDEIREKTDVKKAKTKRKHAEKKAKKATKKRIKAEKGVSLRVYEPDFERDDERAGKFGSYLIEPSPVKIDPVAMMWGGNGDTGNGNGVKGKLMLLDSQEFILFDFPITDLSVRPLGKYSEEELSENREAMELSDGLRNANWERRNAGKERAGYYFSDDQLEMLSKYAEEEGYRALRRAREGEGLSNQERAQYIESGNAALNMSDRMIEKMGKKRPKRSEKGLQIHPNAPKRKGKKKAKAPKKGKKKPKAKKGKKKPKPKPKKGKKKKPTRKR